MKVLHKIVDALRFTLIAIATIYSGLMVVLLSLLTLRSQWGLKFVAYRVWGPSLLFAAGAKLKVYGLEKLPKKEAVIFVSNHASQMDIPALFRALPLAVHFVAKKELKNIPFLGWAIWASGMIFVDRKNREKALKSMQDAGQLIKKGKNVISFPEGTRSKSGKIQHFKRGSFIIAQSANVGIIPIGIKGAYEVLRPGSLHIRPGTIQIKIGEVFYPGDYPDASPDQLAKIAQEKVSQLLQQIPNN